MGFGIAPAFVGRAGELHALRGTRVGSRRVPLFHCFTVSRLCGLECCSTVNCGSDRPGDGRSQANYVTIAKLVDLDGSLRSLPVVDLDGSLPVHPFTIDQTIKDVMINF